MGGLARQLETRLKEEQSYATTPERVRQMAKQVDEIDQRVFVSPIPQPTPNQQLSSEQSSFYRTKFRQVAGDVFGLRQPQQQQRIHDIAEGERQKILDRLTDVSQVAGLLRDAINRRERLFNELRDVETKLQSTSDDEHIAELIKKSTDAGEKIGELNQEKRTLEGEVQRLRADSAARQRQIDERQRTRDATTEAKRQVKLGQEVRRVLDIFIRDLAREKLETLRSRFEEMYGLLRRPEDPWRSVEIDSETWQIILKDEKARPLEKRVFSAGMKEIYALSLLWALSRASGRELPIVIDTPVGRLDTTNRRALFEKYLPNAGHQVVVLSTDTEVDVAWAQRLAPYVSRQYRLDYDSTKDTTVIRPGYFF